MNKLSTNHYRWINCSKFIAISAVLIDHTSGVLYTNPMIAQASFFSVTLFVLLAGMTSYYSNRKRESLSYVDKTIKSLSSILVPYLIAVAVYQLVQDRSFNVVAYCRYALCFNISAPFYFVLFYIQLCLIGPVLYNIIQKIGASKVLRGKFLLNIAILSVLVLFAAFAIRYTYVLPVHGGGRFLFGGSYLLFYYLGMWFASMNISLGNLKTKIAASAISLALWISWFAFYHQDNFALDKRLFFGPGVNPPSISLGFLGLLSLCVCFCLFSLLEESRLKPFHVLYSILDYLGKHSLYIFLYHFLVLSIILSKMGRLAPDLGIYMKWVIVFPGMVLIPVLGKNIFLYFYGKLSDFAFTRPRPSIQ